MAVEKWFFSPTKLDGKYDTFESITIQLASPEKIRAWSYGEVKKPDTINYRTYKPEFEGLFCERIFGPTKDYECACGKYKRMRYKGVVCDRCGVEVTHHRVRRERMGHIELAVPVVHIWFYGNTPSIIATLLDMKNSDLEKIIYYESYIVIESEEEFIPPGTILSDEDYYDLLEEGKKIKALIGGEAVKYLLKNLDLDDLAADLRNKIKIEVTETKKLDLLKRLKIVDKMRHSGNRPEWMVLDVIPVLPPDLRPLVPLEGGRFASSDLNDLYRRVINRNNRLKKLMEIEAPEVILKNEMRMLQEAVDCLFENGKRKYVFKGESRRPLKSLSEILNGKKGRFRQNLLGKRVDYSGRSVIVVGPELKIFEAGIPKVMALELFKPFVISKLEKKRIVHSIKVAKKMINDRSPEVWDILEEIIEDHPILLNRAPTLHRVSIQAFYIKLTEGYAIRLSPFVCAAFNADFDGDQMAVHVPLSFEAILEARIILMSSRNTLSPAGGKPLAVPSQDTVLGNYYLTKVLVNGKGEGKRFASLEEATFAYENGIIGLHSEIYVRINKNGKEETIKTTYGRLVFNSILPEDYPFINKLMPKKELSELVYNIYKKYPHSVYIKFLDDLKDLGFYWATKSGISLGVDDIEIPKEKERLIERSMKQVREIIENYEMGFITERERTSQIIDIWTHTTNKVAEILMQSLSKSKNGFNPLFMMADSGARGSKEQIRQLAGMRGLMAKPQKKMTGEEVIETPIVSNFKEGLNIFEYYLSTHGARKGLADTALKTADAGYLTRRLVDVSQDLIVNEEDCYTNRGIELSAVKQGEGVVVSLAERINGRVSLNDIFHPETGEIILGAGELITEEKAKEIEEAGIERVVVRSVLTCATKYGVCQKCYGVFPATGKLVDVGTAIGVVASQSIGEPGTQLTLRTFHIGGTATRIAAERTIVTKYGGKVKIKEVEIIETPNGEKVSLNRNGEILIVNPEDEEDILFRIQVPIGAILKVNDGDIIEENTELYEHDPYNTPLLSEKNGILKFVDVVKGETLTIEEDEATGTKELKITESKKLHPHLEIVDKKTKEVLQTIHLPVGAILTVEDGSEVEPGQVLAKIPKQSGITTDITGGLPRVSELFEAKKPSDAAVLSEVDGTVIIGDIKRKNREVIVIDENGVEHKYQIPAGRHILVLNGHKVKAGEPLCDGKFSPHDILKIKGISAVQEYLLNEIQEVYRLQGVNINDKHIEAIIRQMMRKVRILKEGDTSFLYGDIVNREEVLEENRKVIEQGGEPCEYEPVLLGITKASLTTESFISAASFQETTRVLASAAIAGKKDYLRGLKENVIIGRLIPAGTGNKKYANVRILDNEIEVSKSSFDDDDLMEL